MDRKRKKSESPNRPPKRSRHGLSPSSSTSTSLDQESWPTQDIVHLDLETITPPPTIPGNLFDDVLDTSSLFSSSNQHSTQMPITSTPKDVHHIDVNKFFSTAPITPLSPFSQILKDLSTDTSVAPTPQIGVADQELAEVMASKLSDSIEKTTPPVSHIISQTSNIQGIDSIDIDFLKKEWPSYEPIAPIASGAYGAVYKARILPGGTECALKILKAGVMQANRDSSVNEFKIVRRLYNNPNRNVLQCYNPLHSQNRFYMGSELSSIGDLYTFMMRRNPQNQIIWQSMNELNAKYVIRGVANGLSQLHGMGIAHGDLKPENILLFDSTNSGQTTDVTKLVPKLCDFSNSQMRNPQNDPPGQIMANCRHCTINYSAPESGIDVCPPFDMISADVYSLGCNLLALLLGTSPFAPNMSYAQNAGYEQACNQLKLNPTYLNTVISAPLSSTNLRDILRRSLSTIPRARITLHNFLMHQWFLSLTL